KHHWRVFGDADGDGLTEVRWFRDDGRFVDDGYLDGNQTYYVVWQLDGDELGDRSPSLFFAYNGWSGPVQASVPPPPEGTRWQRVLDTSPGGAAFGWAKPEGAPPLEVDAHYEVAPRSLIGLEALPIGGAP